MHNKYAYGLALLAVLITLSTFREGLRAVEVDLNVITTNLYVALLPLVFSLGLSAYLFALSLISRRFYAKIGRCIVGVADVFYVFAVIYPFVFMLCWGIAVLLPHITITKAVLDATSTAIMGIGTILSLVATSKAAQSFREMRHIKAH